MDVSELQNILIAGGYLNIAAPTGFYGAMTKAAVSAYQGAHGLPQVGIVGPKTRAALNSCNGSSMSTGSMDKEAMIAVLKAKLAELMAQLNALLAAKNATGTSATSTVTIDLGVTTVATSTATTTATTTATNDNAVIV